ncbi:hypothetical protein EHYA_06974 [Embleya hyalina]|uniref:Uncharacterized protein n=2 Tax=Embleya hyalina TaxID=516124 RepID=A0A401YXI2_9ACTN|nr:hypothetical protein EHYA_06974 [Embleya hyalina]
MATARKVMEKDGYHRTLCFLYKGEIVTAMQDLEFHDQETKILTFERIADLVESTRSDGVLIIGEVWTAVQTETEKQLQTILFPARDRLDRTEGLTVYAVTRDGRHAELYSVVERGPNGEAHCGEPAVADFGGSANAILPIKRRWADMEKRGI